jgi:hypothetical protein
MKIQIFFTTIALLTLSCQNQSNETKGKIEGYNLSSPDIRIVLPKILHEISGQAVIDSATIACIQDEKGILFLYDMINDRIRAEYPFSGDGDYEDIARVDSTIYILRSDGKIFEIRNFGTKNDVSESFRTGIPCEESEGLCFDNRNNRLLISCKGETHKKDLRNKIVVYSIDINKKKLSDNPVIAFDLTKVRNLVSGSKESPGMKNKKRTKPVITLKISAIAVHPLTGELFMLSAIDYMIYVSSMDGTIRSFEPLNRKLFNQAEGLSFLPNGDMLITNEGGEGKPSLLRFNYRANLKKI